MKDIGELNINTLTLEDNEFLAFTTNGCTKPNGDAVMGAGIAKAVSELYPNISSDLGRTLQRWGNHVFVFESYRLISFPTKGDWRNPSTLDLIDRSCSELCNVMDEYEMAAVYLPRPGCHNGGLQWKDVLPVLRKNFGNRDVRVFHKPVE